MFSACCVLVLVVFRSLVCFVHTYAGFRFHLKLRRSLLSTSPPRCLLLLDMYVPVLPSPNHRLFPSYSWSSDDGQGKMTDEFLPGIRIDE
ncbi:hypothetical protein K1T71_014704 [Dendrolimus kikuchii]|uniref:Uncharacterized protein n=1 Tax=Dendrolimus kikuchii TaxID=765133 RepID=A0ACC1CEZ9_9NEOP|nr:hypothetical protein K1T71_014704 [Dendrolimus kikuchii]